MRWLAVILTAVLSGAHWIHEDPPLPADDLPADLFDRPVPAGLPASALPPRDAAEGRRQAKARFDLGRKVFFDPLLSVDRTVSCASCHEPHHGFASPAALSLGVQGQRTLRNAPTLFNRALGKRQMWDGSAASLADQVLLPIENPLEMGLSIEEALGRLAAEPWYAQRFAAAYPDGLTRANLADSLVAFLRHLLRGDAPVDRFRAGERSALTDAARRGLWIYESKGRCWKCHSGANFSDEDFHNTGVGAVVGVPEEGRFAVTGESGDSGRFKTPTLRGLRHTAPYMHDGSLASLEEVVEFYLRGANANHNLDPAVAPIELTDREIADLVAFLRSL